MGGSLKHPEPAHGGEPLARCYSSGSMGEPGKAGGKGRPAGGRTPPRAPLAPPAKAARSPHGSPTKLPTKAGAGKAGTPRGEEPAGTKAAGVPRKVPPAPERPGTGPPPPPGATGHSAIEEKVMKGIEENVLRLQGQERAPAGEAKGKAASGLASWFGLRRSKLPALSRRGDGGRGREWAGTPAPLRREVKLAARKLEAESLNISKLMEKAEDLRKALREEHAFLQGLALEKGCPRGPPRGPPGHLPVMYQEVTAETFMQQLLDRLVVAQGLEGGGWWVSPHPTPQPDTSWSPGWTERTCPTRAAWSTSGSCVTSDGSPPTPKTPGSATRPATASWDTYGSPLTR